MSATRLLASGIQADVYLTRRAALVVVKVVHAPADGDDPRLRPHNVAREARLLGRLRHPNVVTLLDYSYTTEHRLTLEVLPLPLFDIAVPLAMSESAFMFVARGLFSALGFLHAEGVAHRDIKPGNICISAEGEPKLIDLATAWDGGDGKGDDGGGGMVCQVGTGPYRAPELLFGPVTYDAAALDLWAAGATLAELYRHLTGWRRAPGSRSDGGSSHVSSLSGSESPPLSLDGGARSSDVALFDATYGDLGLAGSIFSVLGTPTAESSPSFFSLPDAGKIHFNPQPQQDLSTLLGAPEGPTRVLEAVLRLEPAQRASAQSVVQMVKEGKADGWDREVRAELRRLARERMGELERSLEGEFGSDGQAP
ncbi:kinase-like protein [Cutaneotrichosporon oleaginosum]|uniref:Kinase-like protein n=1 Tax=Cutaneotrichosporon oleaginosum TaxID=879819 RepID=A0A0J0XW83_9TREE|nr:kinase-like protein [Cutaneotrichosporon oleaginosum]KLT45336.1 kinase-like protein [Cutaneotrichosporon oleaginosum]TXT14835.1 hypothetical protein COLE_01028 [Cutaneotrichosporon oleaginosum]